MDAALIVKPALWRRSRSRSVIDGLMAGGATVMSGSSLDELRAEALALPDTTALIACGGDGTVHLAVNSIAGTARRMGIVPMGTGNDIAGHFGIRGAAGGLRALETGRTAAVDVGHIVCDDGTSRYFAGVASCGFDAHVNERANRYRGPQGTAKYLVALVAELGALAAREMHVTDDAGERSQLLTMVAIGNTSRYGGGMKVCPDADARDGMLTVTSVDEVSRRTLMTVLPRVFAGTHVRHRAVTVSHTTRLALRGGAFPVYADGERVGVGPVDVSVMPQALSLILPA